jgi:hypothetical protein
VRGVLLILLAGCGGQPAPEIRELSPAVVCGSGTLPLALHGDHFLARAISTLEGQSAIEVPSARLTPMSGTVVFPEVVWFSTQLLSLRVALGDLAAGAYALEVTNPDGQKASLASALTRVELPPVAITSVSPQPICIADGDGMFQINGSGFQDLSTVSILDGTGAMVAQPSASAGATQVRFTLPRASLMPGNYTVVVMNPPMDGCSATAAAPLVLDAPPVLNAVPLGAVCGDGGQITVMGNNLLAGATVELTDGTITIAATRVNVMGSTAQITFGSNNFAKNEMATLTWHNPDGCSVTLPNAVRIKPGRGGC